MYVIIIIIIIIAPYEMFKYKLKSVVPNQKNQLGQHSLITTLRQHSQIQNYLLVAGFPGI